jgi:hypothetical protein
MDNRAPELRLALTSASTLFLLYLLCWVGAVIWPAGPSHMFIALFTTAPIDSITALAIGGCSAIVVGALIGALAAWTYNLTAPFARKL